MKRFFVFVLVFITSSVVFADVPINAPSDANWCVIDGKIYTDNTGGLYALGNHCWTRADCEAILAAWEEYKSDFEDFYGAPPENFGMFDEPKIIEWSHGEFGVLMYLSDTPAEGLGESFFYSDLYFNNWFFQHGLEYAYTYGMNLYDAYTFAYYADAEYSEEPEPEPALPDGLSDGVVTFHDGVLVYTSEGYYMPNGSTVIFSGPSLWASSEEEAETCARNFSSFSQSYSWVFHDEPKIPLWTEPKVYKCYSITNGEVSFIFWRIFFQDYTSLPAAAEFDAAYGQILNDYSQGAGGSGGYNVIALYGESAEASAVNVGTNLLNGETIGQGNSGTSSITLKNGGSDVTVAQDTVQNISARNTVGVSEVTSNASVDEDSNGNINVTNQTTINTTIELGDAPTGGEFVDDSDLGEKEVNSFFDEERTEEPPVFTYVEIYNEDYRINYSKLWDDIKLELGNIFPIEALESYFNRSGNSGTMPVIPVQASFPEVGFYFDYAIDMNEVLVNDITLIVRQILSFLIVFETAILCLNLVRG